MSRDMETMMKRAAKTFEAVAYAIDPEWDLVTYKIDFSCDPMPLARTSSRRWNDGWSNE